MNICLLYFFILYFSVFYGCSLIAPENAKTEMSRHERDFKAQQLLDKLKQHNSSLISFKGIGNITLQRNDNFNINERLAWICARPLSFSVVILVSGYPILKLSGNGRWIFYHNPNGVNNTYQKLRSKNPSLKRLISVPIKASDLIALMAGCIPILDHDFVTLMPDLDGSDDVLLLKKRSQIRQKIYLNHDGNPNKMEVLNGKDRLLYWVQVEKLRTIDGYAIPMELTLHAYQNEEPVTCQLLIDRYWVNVSVSPSTFILSKPELKK